MIERMKIYVEMLKFKITLFSTILGGVIYLLLHKNEILDTINVWVFWVLSAILLAYGLIGFVKNVELYNKALERLEREIEDE